jgi:hypothetical protein
MANGEIGIKVERFEKAKLKEAPCSDSRSDGFDADRLVQVDISKSRFINDFDDSLELFPIDLPAAEQPADFPGNIVEEFKDLTIFGNVGEEINYPDIDD